MLILAFVSREYVVADGAEVFAKADALGLESRALEDWAWQRGGQFDFIHPGRPVENAYIESFNGKLRDECLNVHQFHSIADAQSKIEAWRRDYNEERPRGSLANLIPGEFVRRFQSTRNAKVA